MTAKLFHPATQAWFERHFGAATTAQTQAWPAIRSGKNVLVAAPTGSGKTLAAFLVAIDDLVRQGQNAPLPQQTQVLYVSPLKALSNDIQKNLQTPIAGIRAELAATGLPDVEIQAWVRTGDTTSVERSHMRKHAPHILVTTPESLYILLGSESGRKMLATVKSVIVDEIHALAGNKRGAHLALSLERLDAICAAPPVRIGLSATQKPIEDVADFLAGANADGKPRPCTVVDTGHTRSRDLAVEIPAPLEAVMSNENWELIYDRLANLIDGHRTTLVFVNTRRLVERVTSHLSERLGEENVAAHHGSLSKEKRLDAETRLKHGKLKALVATASLELGIDIGEVDLVCQIGVPRSIASFLQRVGRSGHAVVGTPKGRLFPLSRDELVESTALLDSVRRGELDRLKIPDHPLDVLSQQIVAEAATREMAEEELFTLARGAWPFRHLERKDFDAVIAMLAQGFTTRRGRRSALIHHDAVHGVVKGRRGAGLTALTSGGAIPDNADYKVLLEPENLFIGTVNEDFAVESLAGDIFQLGNHSYRLLRVERGAVRVEDAHGMPPTIPFWLGEAPGRSDELSGSVSRLRSEIDASLERDATGETAIGLVQENAGLDRRIAEDLVAYLHAGRAALGGLPTQHRIVFERFFDEAGGMQFVIHSPYGSRINRAWGLALRKRFCRKFNFELQAAATEDNIVLSLTESHSFELADVARYLNSATVKPILVQALLDAPMFTTRWRWVAGISLALPRYRGGKKVPPQIARMIAEDLVAAVFPDQIACGENIVGDREVPDHPLVNQTIDDCLDEAMDFDGFERLLKGIETGEVEIVCRDLTEPSPLALEVLSARPYAYLDDAPLEERRTQAVMARRWMTPESAADLGRLDAEAIARVKSETWPEPRNADELHDALVWLGFVTEGEAVEGARWTDWLNALSEARRAARLSHGETVLWIAAERVSLFRARWPDAQIASTVQTPQSYDRAWTKEEALQELLRGRMEGIGPVTADQLARSLGIEISDILASLSALEAEGFALRGKFSPNAGEEEWCDRRLLARVHSYTVKRLRAEIQPVSSRDYMRFLFNWQRVVSDRKVEGADALEALIAQLEGFNAPISAWENEILPARMTNYRPSTLDELCLAGKATWARLRIPNNPENAADARRGPARNAAIALFPRRHVTYWRSSQEEGEKTRSPAAQAVMDFLREHGASFFDEIADGAQLLRAETENALGELVSSGDVMSDSFRGLRALALPSHKRKNDSQGRSPIDGAGRWSLAAKTKTALSARDRDASVEHIARVLLRRYGIVFWHMLAREAAGLPPWRDLLRAYRTMEARGEIRGGRFVAGFSGEQFALTDAIGLLRETRRAQGSDEFSSLAAVDPLNLLGIVVPGPKIPALSVNRVLFRDGLPIAAYAGGEVQFFEPLEGPDAWEARKALLRSPARAGIGGSKSFARSLERGKKQLKLRTPDAADADEASEKQAEAVTH